MGWERKRGKLAELNRLLRGATDTSYAVVSGPLPGDVRYVITLDADTRLLRGTVAQMVHRGTLDRHPDGGVLRSSVMARLAR